MPLGKSGMLGNWTWLKQERTCLKTLTSPKIPPLLLPSVPPSIVNTVDRDPTMCLYKEQGNLASFMCPPSLKSFFEQDPLSPLKRDSLSNAKWLSWRVLMVGHLLEQKELKCQINLVLLTLEFLYQLPQGRTKTDFVSTNKHWWKTKPFL